MKEEEGFVVGFLTFSWTGKNPAILPVKCPCRGAGFLMFYTLNGFSAASNVEEDVLAKFRDWFLFLEEIHFLSCSACILNFIFPFPCEAKPARTTGQRWLCCHRAGWGGSSGVWLPSGIRAPARLHSGPSGCQPRHLRSGAAESWSLTYQSCPFPIRPVPFSGMRVGKSEVESQETPCLAALVTPFPTWGRE